MRRLLAIAGLILVVSIALSCQGGKDNDQIGAAGKAEELADSTRLDSSMQARNRAGGQPSSAHDTI